MPENPSTHRESPERSTGVCGVGINHGVFGRGFTGAGVYGENESNGAGVFGIGRNISAIAVAALSTVGFANAEVQKTASSMGIFAGTESGKGFGVVGLSVESFGAVPDPEGIPRIFLDDQDNPVLPKLSSGIGVLGASDSGTGIRGISNSGDAVQGNSSSGPGIEGVSNSGIGVIGRSTDGVGAFFTSLHKEAVVGHTGGAIDAVLGIADSGAGIKGESNGGFGVSGDSQNQSGVVGRSRGTIAPGVFGTCDKFTGVAGRSISGLGVYGQSTEQAGVVGKSSTTAGVFGSADAAFKLPLPSSGVLGINDKSVGVLGSSLGVIGVWGSTNQGIGIFGTANQGAGVPTNKITDQGIGVIGLANIGVGAAGMSTSGTGVFGSSESGLAGHFKGAVTIEGDLTIVGGIKSAAVPHTDGSYRQMYCMESPESWFEDFGEARLVNGKGEVQLDPDFAALVDVNNYQVFLTAYGDSRGIFVATRNATGFRVSEQQGGTSNVSFGYRVVARRKDVAANRLAKVTLPDASSKTQLPDPRLKITLPDFERLSVIPVGLTDPVERP
ncbi:MAG TPA: hypothetical protein VK578_22410 [Edaphobacter sp.]|nr:hypothetical protein [Edaphobacter sp.]